MGLTQLQGQWTSIQSKVFSRWVSEQLNLKTDLDITKDLKSGVALVELAIILTRKETPRKWNRTPRFNVNMVQNCDLALDMFQKDGVHFIGISGRDINENNEKLILGLVWTLISHYSIGNSRNSKADLLKWAQERTENYPNVHKFTPYELSMCALLDSYVPDKIDFNSLNPKDTEYNSQLATDVMNELGIPIYIYPEDYNNQEARFDQQVLLTQLSAAKTVLESLEPQVHITERSINISEDFVSMSTESDSEQNDEQTDNFQYNGQKFGLLMKFKKSEFAVTLKRESNWFLNPAGLKLDITSPNIENDVCQQFTFGKDGWNTVIDSVEQRGMVFDVCDADNENPAAGTPFYLFPFHGRHNQHFVMKDGMIVARQNGMVVTYVGGEEPFQMMPPSEELKDKQTFTVKLL